MPKLKIAIYCTNEFSCPLPKEIIYAPMDLAEEMARGLSRRGHDVTFYCSSDSKIEAKKVSNGMISYYKLKGKIVNGGFHDQLQVAIYEQLLASKMFEDARSEKYDMIHCFHLTPKLLPFVNIIKTPVIFTFHDPLDAKWLDVIRHCTWKNEAYYVSISNNQRKGMPDLNFAGTVYNGIDISRFKFKNEPENHLAFLGRYNYEKGVDVAVSVARISGKKLKLAGNIWGNGFYNEKVKPYLKKGQIEDVGYLAKDKVSDFLGRAKALLFPIRWQEPFGLVMIEAMACGTPVIAFKNGSIPEIVKHGKTGFIVKNEQEMVEAVKNINKIRRSDCRKYVEENFTVEKMVDGYEKIYEKILREGL